MTAAIQKREIVRILLPTVLSLLLGLSAPLRSQVRSLQSAAEYLESADEHAAALQIARAADYSPWRSDLWVLAGSLAFQTGDMSTSIEILTHADQHDALPPEGKLILGDAYFQSGDLTRAIHSWLSTLTDNAVTDEAHRRLVSAYQQIGDFEQAARHLRMLLAGQPANPELNYQLGITLAAIDPETSLAYLSLAGDSNPAYRDRVSTLRREILSARRSGDRAFLYLSAGRVLASFGEWRAAYESFSRAINANPTYAEAWAYLGEAEHHLDGDGLDHLQKALALNPRSLAANTFLALYWQRHDRFDLATLYLQVAEEIEPKNPAIQAELGNTLALAGKLQKAEAHYQKAVELSSRDPLYWRKLAEFSVMHDYKVRQIGLPAARQAVLLNPNEAASLDVMAQVFSFLGDPLSALRFLDRAMRINASYAPAHLHLGVIYLIRGETQKAYRHLSLAKELAEPDSSTYDHARRLLNQISK